MKEQTAVTLTPRDQTRMMVLNQVLAGQLTASEAAQVLILSVRQVRRVLAAYREDGVAAMVHGNRGRTPAHAISADCRHQILTLARTRYAGVNDRHLSELLAEREDITVSRSSLRRILREAGIASPRTRRAPVHRQRRERKPQAGLLVQIDGSPHRWLDDRGPRGSLLAAIDDATGTVVAALFRAEEDAHGYFLLLRQCVTSVGCPVAVYHDRHSIFRVVSAASIAEQLADQTPRTQFSRLLGDLGIGSIVARSPQAKGRVERLFGTLQDRLVVELRLADITTLDAATAFLADYLPRFNAQFAVPPAQATAAWRALDPALDLEQVFAFISARTVAADNTVQFNGQRLQIQPDRQRSSYARTRVAVYQHLDGRLTVVYQGRTLLSQPAPLDAPVLRARGTPAQQSTPPSDASLPDPPGPILDQPHVPADPAPPATALARPAARSKPAADHPWRHSGRAHPVS
jgi:transposase